MMEKLVPEPFIKNQKLTMSLDGQIVLCITSRYIYIYDKPYKPYLNQCIFCSRLWHPFGIPL